MCCRKKQKELYYNPCNNVPNFTKCEYKANLVFGWEGGKSPLRIRKCCRIINRVETNERAAHEMRLSIPYKWKEMIRKGK